MKVVITIDFPDEAQLDEYVRDLFDPPDDPAPGEPFPGRQMVFDWADEMRANVSTGMSPDTLWWQSPNYESRISVEVIEW